jgi:carboxypeptidase T
VMDYDTDAHIKELVDTRVIHMMPMVNPDGHVKAESGKNWRKNTHPFKTGVGVDLNRNFPFKWDLEGNGATTDPASETYKGESPASEPETQAEMIFLSGIPNLKIGMDYHSYSNLIMWSWGWTSQPAPDEPLLRTIGTKLASFNGYTPKQASGLYPTSGTIRDWTYATLKVPYYTTEMGSEADGFDPSYTRTQALIKENLPGAIYLTEIAPNPQAVLGLKQNRR